MLERTARTATKLGGGIAIVVAVLVGLIATAPSAHAHSHHGNIDITDVVCDEATGRWKVSFRATSWRSTNWTGSHTDIEVFWSDTQIDPATPEGSAAWRALATQVLDGGVFDVWEGADNPAIEGPLRTEILGSFLLPLGYTGTFYVATYANGGWGPDPDPSPTDDFRAGGETYGFDFDVALEGEAPGDCSTPGAPGATAEVRCDADDARFALTNTGGTAVTLDVVVGGAVVADDVAVPAGTDAGAPVEVAIPLADLGLDEGESLPWLVETGDGTDVASGDLVVDCLDPAAPAVVLADECATGDGGADGITLTLANTGGEPFTFEVPAPVGSVDVGPAATSTVFLPVAEDAAYAITVTGAGFSETVEGTRDCEDPGEEPEPAPRARVADPCASNGLAVLIGNDGEVPIGFAITNKGAAVADVQLAAGSEQTVAVPVTEDDTYAIRVVAGAGILDQTLSGTRNCSTVLGSQEVRTPTQPAQAAQPAQLARTGSDPAPALLQGLGLVFVGLGLVLVADQRRFALLRRT